MQLNGSFNVEKTFSTLTILMPQSGLVSLFTRSVNYVSIQLITE